MNDLIHRIVGIIIEAGQSDTKKFRLGETIRYTPSEILEILKQHENEIFGEEPSTQTNTSNTLNALDCVSRAQALNNIRSLYPEAPRINFMDNLAQWKKKYSQYMECEEVIKRLPSAQQWIPVSEKLPEEAGWYLCTYKDGRVNTKYWSKDKGWVDNIRLHMFELYDIRSRITKEEVKLAQESIYWNDWVVTWSQLPEPYKEGER